MLERIKHCQQGFQFILAQRRKLDCGRVPVCGNRKAASHVAR